MFRCYSHTLTISISPDELKIMILNILARYPHDTIKVDVAAHLSKYLDFLETITPGVPLLTVDNIKDFSPHLELNSLSQNFQSFEKDEKRDFMMNIGKRC